MSRLFGPLRQNGFVVRDIAAAMRHWTEVCGIGPFFHIEEQPVDGFRHRGEPSDVKISVALAQSGDIQIELIQQRNSGRSAFRDFLDAGREGLQHVGFWTDEFDRDLRRARERGLEVLQSGRSGSGAADERFVYFTAQAHPGTIIELSETAGRKGTLFRAVAEAARGWDGRDPIRDMAQLLEAA